MNQTFWMARSQTHNDHDAKVISRLFFSTQITIFTHFFGENRRLRGVNRDFLESKKISRWYQRNSVSSNRFSSTRGHTSDNIVIKGSPIILLKNAIFSLFWRKKNMNCQVYGRTTPLCHSASSQRRETIHYYDQRNYCRKNCLKKIVKIIN